MARITLEPQFTDPAARYPVPRDYEDLNQYAFIQVLLYGIDSTYATPMFLKYADVITL